MRLWQLRIRRVSTSIEDTALSIGLREEKKTPRPRLVKRDYMARDLGKRQRYETRIVLVLRLKGRRQPPCMADVTKVRSSQDCQLGQLGWADWAGLPRL